MSDQRQFHPQTTGTAMHDDTDESRLARGILSAFLIMVPIYAVLGVVLSMALR